MKKKLLLTGILVAVLVLSIVFTGCKGKTEQNKAEQAKGEENKVE